MTELENYLSGYFGIPQNELASIAAMFEAISLKKGEYFVKKDQYSQTIGFLRNGFIRFFASDHHGNKEITQWIASGGNFIAEISSFTFKTPSRFNIQALTDCQLYVITNERWNEIVNVVPKWPELEKLFLTKCFVTMENRIFAHLSMTAEERYLELFQTNPELLNQVPLQHLASMLGMSPETFSRVRKKLMIK